MTDWLRENWEKLLGVLVGVGGFVFTAYRRFTRMEDRMDALEKALRTHAEEDRRLGEKLDRLDEKVEGINVEVRAMAVRLAEREKSTDAIAEDVREVRADIKALLARR